MILNEKFCGDLTDYYVRHGYKIKEYNIFSVRNMKSLEDDIFNDVTGHWQPSGLIKAYISTTDPGRSSILKGGVPGTGAPFLCSGMQEDILCIGKHGKTRYEAFVNNWKCAKQRFIRDKNRNFKLDPDEKIEYGRQAMNLHRASLVKDVPVIGPYSEGCTVLVHAADLTEMLMDAKQTDMYRKVRKTTLFSHMIFELPEMEAIYKQIFK